MISDLPARALRGLHVWLHLSFNFAVRSPKTTLFVMIFPLLMGLPQLRNLETLVDTDDLIDADFTTHGVLSDLKSKFKSKNSLLLMVEPNQNPMSIGQGCLMSNWIASEVLTRGDIELVLSTFQLRHATLQDSKVSYPRYLSSDCQNSSASLNLSPLAATPWGGILTDTRFRDAAVEFDLSGTETSKGPSFDPTIVPAFMANAATWSQDQNLNLYWYGSTVFQYFMKLGYDQTALLNLLVVAFLVVFFKLAHGTFKSSVIFLLSLSYVNLCLHVFMSLAGYPVDVLSNSLFLMLTLATIEDYIYLSDVQLVGRHYWKNEFRNVLLPGFLTTLTTVIGFGSLALADLGIIKRFGVVSAIGSFAEWVAIFIFLPALIQIFPKLKVWTTRGQNPPLSRIKILGFKTPPRWFATVSLSFFLIALYGSGHLKIDDTPHDLFPKDHPVHSAVNYLRESRSWEASADVLISAPEKEAEVIRALKEHPMVVQIEAPDLYRKHFTENLPASYKAVVDEDITNAPIYSRYVSSDGTVRLILYLNKTDLSAVNGLRSFVSRLCPQGECQLGGSLVSYAEFGSRVPEALMESLLSSMFWVIITMVFLTLARGEKEFFPIVASSLWGPAFLIAMLYLLQVKIYFVTCIFASILVGFAGDNAVHYLFSSKSNLKDGIHDRALPSMYLGICMIIIPLVFLLSHFNPMRSLGILFVVGAAAGIFGDLWILKGLLRRNT